MKPQYEAAIAKIEKLSAEWERLFGLEWVHIDRTYVEGFKADDDPATIAETQTFWQYRVVVMRWYLPAVVRLSDEELDGDICHEYVHVLIAPMESHVPDKWEEQCEFAVQGVALAFLNARKLLTTGVRSPEHQEV